jgi:hypothetical protein
LWYWQENQGYPERRKATSAYRIYNVRIDIKARHFTLHSIGSFQVPAPEVFENGDRGEYFAKEMVREGLEKLI